MTTPYGGAGAAASPWVQASASPQNQLATASLGLGVASMFLVTPAILASLYPDAFCGLVCLGSPFICISIMSSVGAIVTGFRGMNRAATMEGQGYGAALGGAICAVLAILLALFPLFRLAQVLGFT